MKSYRGQIIMIQFIDIFNLNWFCH